MGLTCAGVALIAIIVALVIIKMKNTKKLEKVEIAVFSSAMTENVDASAKNMQENR